MKAEGCESFRLYRCRGLAEHGSFSLPANICSRPENLPFPSENTLKSVICDLKSEIASD
jgi:hypothetical protein